MALLEDARVNVNQLDHEGYFPLWQACVHLTLSMSNMGACDGRFDDHTDPIRGLVLFLRSRRVSTAALDQSIDLCKLHHPSEREISLAEAGGKQLNDFHLMARHVLPILQAEAKGQKRWCDWCFRVTPDQDLLLCSGCWQVGYCNRECCQKKGWAKASGEAMEGAKTRSLCGLPSCSAKATSDCSSCKTRGYCSKEHQRDDWKAHKVECKRTRKASEAAEAECGAADACAGMAAEAAKAKADKAEGKDSSGGAGGAKAKKTKPNEKCP